MAFFDWLFGRSPEPHQRHQPRSAAPENWTPKIIRTPTRPTFTHAQRVGTRAMPTNCLRLLCFW